MSDSRYSYDENSEVWPYFGVTLLGIIVIPATVISVRRILKAGQLDDEDASRTVGKSSESLVKFRTSNRKSQIWTAGNMWLLVGWSLIAVLLYIIYSTYGTGESQNLFDPYAILDISYSASEKEIKSAYRKLSLQFHPDKIKDLGELTAEFVEARYVDITKAYKALTDETLRENFLKYGHPDGPRQTFHGVALPKFLVESSGSPFVIAVYTAVIGVVLPIVVGRWWNGSKAYTKTGIHQKTAEVFFELCAKEQPHFISYEMIFNALSEAQEYAILLPDSTPKEIRKLIDAHLSREELSTSEEIKKFTVIARAPKLLSAFLDIASAFKSIALCRKVISVEKAIIQAVPIKDEAFGEVLQIPGAKIGKKIEISSDSAEYTKQIPKLHVLSARFKVPGDPEVTPQSQCHLIVKYTILPQGVALPKIDPERLVDETDSDDAPISVLKDPISTNDRGSLLPVANTPLFPGFEHLLWYGFLVSERDGKIIDGPVELKKSTCWGNMALGSKDLQDGSKVEIGTFKIQMTVASPPVAGPFHIGLDLICNSYYGTDVSTTVKMTVVDPASLPQIETPEDDEIEDEKIYDEESDSEEEEDLTDIDTDTSDEEEEEEEEDEEPTKEK